MPRDIDVIEKEHDTLLRNAWVWQKLVETQKRDDEIFDSRDPKIIFPVDTRDLYMNLIDNAILVLDALSKEKKDHPNAQNSNNGDGVNPLPIEETKKEFTAVEITPVADAEEMVGGKRQKKRKSKKQMKKRKSGKKTRRSKK